MKAIRLREPVGGIRRDRTNSSAFGCNAHTPYLLKPPITLIAVAGVSRSASTPNRSYTIGRHQNALLLCTRTLHTPLYPHLQTNDFGSIKRGRRSPLPRISPTLAEKRNPRRGHHRRRRLFLLLAVEDGLSGAVGGREARLGKSEPLLAARPALLETSRR